MPETEIRQGRALGSLRQVCEHYRIRQRAKARLGCGITSLAVKAMMSKIGDNQQAVEDLTGKRCL